MIGKFLSNLNPTQRVLVVFVTVILGGVLYYFILVSPTKSRVAELNNEIAAEKETIESNMGFLNQRDSIYQKRDQFNKYFTVKAEKESKLVNTFIERMEALATTFKLNVASIKASGQTYSDEYIQYTIDVNCSGSMKDIASYIHAVDSARNEMIKVVSFDFRPKRSEEGVLEAKLVVAKMVVGMDASITAKDLVLDRKADVEESI